jgi:hypothetical protein
LWYAVMYIIMSVYKLPNVRNEKNFAFSIYWGSGHAIKQHSICYLQICRYKIVQKKVMTT